MSRRNSDEEIGGRVSTKKTKGRRDDYQDRQPKQKDRRRDRSVFEIPNEYRKNV